MTDDTTKKQSHDADEQVTHEIWDDVFAAIRDTLGDRANDYDMYVVDEDLESLEDNPDEVKEAREAEKETARKEKIEEVTAEFMSDLDDLKAAADELNIVLARAIAKEKCKAESRKELAEGAIGYLLGGLTAYFSGRAIGRFLLKRRAGRPQVRHLHHHVHTCK